MGQSLSAFGHLTLQTGGAGQNILLLPASGGNVGIGTTSPAAKLHVSGGKLAIDRNMDLIWTGASGGVDFSTDYGGRIISYLDDMYIDSPHSINLRTSAGGGSTV